MNSSPKSWRQLQEELRQLGATAIRTRGSHEIWRFADGEIFVVVCHHPHRAVDANVLAKFRRLRARRREPGDPPLLLGRPGSRWPRRVPRRGSDHVKGQAVLAERPAVKRQEPEQPSLRSGSLEPHRTGSSQSPAASREAGRAGRKSGPVDVRRASARDRDPERSLTSERADRKRARPLTRSTGGRTCG